MAAYRLKITVAKGTRNKLGHITVISTVGPITVTQGQNVSTIEGVKKGSLTYSSDAAIDGLGPYRFHIVVKQPNGVQDIKKDLIFSARDISRGKSHTKML